MIIILKTDRWLFQQFAEFFLITDEHRNLRMSGTLSRMMREIVEALISAPDLRGFENYVLINDPRFEDTISDLFMSLITDENGMGYPSFGMLRIEDKWSVLIAKLWTKCFDGLWKISYATASTQVAPSNAALPPAMREVGPITRDSLREKILSSLYTKEREKVSQSQSQHQSQSRYQSLSEYPHFDDELVELLSRSKNVIDEMVSRNNNAEALIASLTGQLRTPEDF